MTLFFLIGIYLSEAGGPSYYTQTAIPTVTLVPPRLTNMVASQLLFNESDMPEKIICVRS